MPYDTEGHELQRLFANWRKLSPRVRSAILVLAEVRPPSEPVQFRKIRRRRSGEAPGWLVTALTILKDSQGRITDREMAVRVGTSTTALCRNEVYQRARRTYHTQPRKIVGNGIKELRNS
jgi:hypothetical protein